MHTSQYCNIFKHCPGPTAGGKKKEFRSHSQNVAAALTILSQSSLNLPKEGQRLPCCERCWDASLVHNEPGWWVGREGVLRLTPTGLYHPVDFSARDSWPICPSIATVLTQVGGGHFHIWKWASTSHSYNMKKSLPLLPTTYPPFPFENKLLGRRYSWESCEECGTEGCCRKGRSWKLLPLFHG